MYLHNMYYCTAIKKGKFMVLLELSFLNKPSTIFGLNIGR